MFCAKCGKPIPSGSAFCPSCGAQVAPPGSPAPQAPISGFDALMKDSAAQGHWIRRLIAYVIDWVLVSVVLAILALIFAIPFLLVSGPAAFGMIFGGVFSVVSGLVLVLYFWVAESYMGASIGKSLMGLKVTVADGRKPTAGEAILRNISKIHWLLLLLDVIVGLAVSKKYNQKYSDQFAGTAVVDATRAP